jgi:pimeloyl-ACP methyl ester carboxylesterase
MTVLRGTVAVLLATALVALGGCTGGAPSTATRDGSGVTAAPGSSASDTTAPPTPNLARFYRQQLDWHGCGGGFQCTRLLVPLDYTHPRAGTMRIAVNRLRASGARRGSLLVNPGGPGASGLDYARAASSIVSKAVRERYDVVGFDPRGVGASRGLQCLTDRQIDRFLAYDGTPDTPAEESGLLRLGEVLGAGCRADDPALVAHVGTRDAARDMDVLRAALGDRRLNLLGKSYGTYLGATYAGLFPRRVGRLVLDGAIDPALSNLAFARGQGIGFERALAAFLDDCLRRSSCPFSGDRASAKARIASFLARLDSQPLPGDGARQLTESLATLAIAAAMYDKGNWQFLREGLAQGLRGDGTDLMFLADYYTDRGPGGRYTTNTNEAIYAINCVDRPQDGDIASTRADAAEVAKVAPLFGAFIVWGNLPCTTWPAPAQGRPAPIKAAGSRPILVVGTTRDPATPYEWAKALASELDAGHLLTYVGDGHTAYRRGNGCIDRAVDAYLLRGALPAAGTRCR